MFSSKLMVEEFVRRSLRASSPLMKPLLTPGRWHVENSAYWNMSQLAWNVFSHQELIHAVLNLSPLYTLVSKKVVSVSEISAVNLIVGWWSIVTLYNELLYVFSASVPEAENLVYETLESEGPIRSFAEDLCFNLCHNNIGKGDRHFSAHGGSVCLKVVNSIELKWVLL